MRMLNLGMEKFIVFSCFRNGKNLLYLVVVK